MEKEIYYTRWSATNLKDSAREGLTGMMIGSGT